MIRIPVTAAELERLVDAEVPTWRTRAHDRTRAFITAGKYDEASPIWSEIKPVFMKLQRYKCAFCERQLATEDHGGCVEWDLEHFRPKSAVDVWPDAAKFPYLTDTASPTGYFWLAYHLFNYSAACKKCNSPLKKTYFPVLASRGGATDDPVRLTETDKPLLPYPIGDIDDDPVEIMTFLGINAIPAKKTGPRRRRADVAIEFFKLNGREELRHERAQCIVFLNVFLNTLSSRTASAEQRRDAEEGRDLLLASAGRHSACATAFAHLRESDPETAKKIAKGCQSLVKQLR